MAIFSLISSHESTFAYDRPYHSAFAILFTTGILSWLIARYALVISTPPSLENGVYSRLPLDDVANPHLSRIRHRRVSVAHLRSGKIKLGLLQFLVASLICLRVELTRQILNNVQCARSSYTMLLPFLLIMFSKWQDTSSIAETDASTTTGDIQHPPSNFLLSFIYGQWSFMLAAASLTYWSFSEFKAGHVRSTYICAEALTFHSLIPILQMSATLLDFTIVILFKLTAFKGHASQDVNIKSAMRNTAVTMLVREFLESSVSAILTPLTRWPPLLLSFL